MRKKVVKSKSWLTFFTMPSKIVSVFPCLDPKPGYLQPLIRPTSDEDPFEYHVVGGHLELLSSTLRAQLRSSLALGTVYAISENKPDTNDFDAHPDGVRQNEGKDLNNIIGVIACFGPGEELRR